MDRSTRIRWCQNGEANGARVVVFCDARDGVRTLTQRRIGARVCDGVSVWASDRRGLTGVGDNVPAE
jgi:hypothetical protein